MRVSTKMILMSLLSAILTLLASCSPSAESNQTGTVLPENIAVVYFSATGNTERVAATIAEEIDADLFEIIPAEPYTSDDLNYNNPNSRVYMEYTNYPYPVALSDDTNAINLSSYDIIFIGYPLWWRNAPSAVVSFLSGKDLSGKTIIPFCTSFSSSFGESDVNLKNNSNSDGIWYDGYRFTENTSENAIINWLNSIEI